MNQIAEVGLFEKVSFDQYLESLVTAGIIRCDPDKQPDVWAKRQNEAYDEWQKIHMPNRATSGSAGYDFYLPRNTSFNTDEPVLIPTGIRAYVEPGWFLMMLPRSGLGFKYGMHLENTAGIIDSDYYFADNEGHIMLKVSSGKNFYLDGGDRFAQGIFMPFGITSNDRPLKAARRGGFGSTGV